jgi:hypothetical protein
MTRKRESDFDRWQRETKEEEAERQTADDRDPEAVMHIDALKKISGDCELGDLRDALLFVIDRVRL